MFAPPARRALHLAVAPLALSRRPAGTCGAMRCAAGAPWAPAAPLPAWRASPTSSFGSSAAAPAAAPAAASAAAAAANPAPPGRPHARLPAPAHPSGLTLFGGSGSGLGLGVPASYEPRYRPSPLNLFFQRYYYMLRGLGVFSRRATVGVNSEAIYRSIEEQATQEGWWDALGLPRTWIAEHAMIALHVWMFHCRFKVDYNVGGEFNGRRMQEQLFERLWEDTTLRIRNAGVRARVRARAGAPAGWGGRAGWRGWAPSPAPRMVQRDERAHVWGDTCGARACVGTAPPPSAPAASRRAPQLR